MFALHINRNGDNETKALKSVAGFNDRIRNSVGSQFFNGKATYTAVNKDDGLIFVDVKVLFPPIHYYFLLFGAVALVLKIYVGVTVMGVLSFLFIFVRSKYFLGFLYKRGLRKEGFKERVRLL